MKALILFRSYYGNTKLVAEAIAQQIQSQGHDADVQDLRTGLPDLRGIGAVVVGAPTRFGRVSGKARRVFRRLKRKGLGSRPVAVFDTIATLPSSPKELEESRKWFEPGAVGIMQKVARDLQLNVFPETLRCEVAGAKGPLAENAMGKAVSYADSFLSFVGKAKGA